MLKSIALYRLHRRNSSLAFDITFKGDIHKPSMVSDIEKFLATFPTPNERRIAYERDVREDLGMQYKRYQKRICRVYRGFRLDVTGKTSLTHGDYVRMWETVCVDPQRSIDLAYSFLRTMEKSRLMSASKDDDKDWDSESTIDDDSVISEMNTKQQLKTPSTSLKAPAVTPTVHSREASSLPVRYVVPSSSSTFTETSRGVTKSQQQQQPTKQLTSTTGGAVATDSTLPSFSQGFRGTSWVLADVCCG